MTQNISNKFREAFEAYDPVNGGKWAQQLASGDIIQLDGNTASASYLVISKDPLTANGESRIATVSTWDMPFETAIGLSMSQRTVGQEFSIEFVSDEEPLVAPAELQIASIQQAASVLTVNTVLPHGLEPGVRIGTRDVTDSRLNYPAIVVATTPSPTQFTVTAAAFGNLPSVTAGPFTSGYVFFRSAMGLAPNGVSMIFENANVTNASMYVRSESGDALPSGTIQGSHAITTGTTASVQPFVTAGAYNFQPTTEFRLTQFIDGVQWSDVGVDSVSAASSRLKRTQVVPDIDRQYRLRVRAVNQPNLTRPVAQIVSAAKTGTTTATVTTDVPHGLTTGDLIQTYGARDQTNFANLTAATAVASVINANQFTVVWGGAVTATTFGGYVSRVNGGLLQAGAVAQVAQSVSRTANLVTLVGNTNWSGVLIGDYVNLVGCRNAVDGATLGLDGPYRVRDIQTVNLVLEPIGSAPTGANIVSTNCGGAVIKRTDMRISYVRSMEFDRLRVELMSRPSGDASTSAPVTVQNTPSVSISGTPAVTNTPATPTTDMYNSAASNNARSIKAAAGTVYSLKASNANAAARFLKLYNKASAPTVGTDVPVLTIPIPATSFVDLDFGALGERFATGIAMAITGAMGDADNTAIAASDVKTNLTYI